MKFIEKVSRKLDCTDHDALKKMDTGPINGYIMSILVYYFFMTLASTFFLMSGFRPMFCFQTQTAFTCCLFTLSVSVVALMCLIINGILYKISRHMFYFALLVMIPIIKFLLSLPLSIVCTTYDEESQKSVTNALVWILTLLLDVNFSLFYIQSTYLRSLSKAYLEKKKDLLQNHQYFK